MNERRPYKYECSRPRAEWHADDRGCIALLIAVAGFTVLVLLLAVLIDALVWVAC